MLKLALTFFIVGLIAALLGFNSARSPIPFPATEPFPSGAKDHTDAEAAAIASVAGVM